MSEQLPIECSMLQQRDFYIAEVEIVLLRLSVFDRHNIKFNK